MLIIATGLPAPLMMPRCHDMMSYFIYAAADAAIACCRRATLHDSVTLLATRYLLRLPPFITQRAALMPAPARHYA